MSLCTKVKPGPSFKLLLNQLATVPMIISLRCFFDEENTEPGVS